MTLSKVIPSKGPSTLKDKTFVPYNPIIYITDLCVKVSILSIFKIYNPFQKTLQNVEVNLFIAAQSNLITYAFLSSFRD